MQNCQYRANFVKLGPTLNHQKQQTLRLTKSLKGLFLNKKKYSQHQDEKEWKG